MTVSVPEGWRMLPGEGIGLWCPVALRLVDDFTGRAPMGRIRATLDAEVTPGAFAPTDRVPLLTEAGLVAFPGLERRRSPAGLAPRRYRVRIDADLYRPRYRATADGEVFDASPWDDVHPPATPLQEPRTSFLFPAAVYPFAAEIRVLHGLVVDAAGNPGPDAHVHVSTLESALSDERGAFSLPLRWAATGAVVDADDLRNSRTGSLTLTLPDDLRRSRTITVT